MVKAWEEEFLVFGLSSWVVPLSQLGTLGEEHIRAEKRGKESRVLFWPY